MINAINGLGSCPYIQTSQRLDQTGSLFDQIDANQDKSLDQNELKTFTDTMSQKTGLSMSVYDIISKAGHKRRRPAQPGRIRCRTAESPIGRRRG